MIEFPCGCGQVLSYPEADSGREVQCPHCGLLNDVPNLSDLPGLNEDGTFKVGTPPPLPEQDRLSHLAYVFRKGTVDQVGDEIDLRNTREDLEEIGHDQQAREVARKLNAPQYDPETGELVRPLNFKDDRPNPGRVPMAKAVGSTIVPYASPSLDRPALVSNIAVKLFLPPNVVVMAFIFIAHVMTNLLLMAMNTGILLLLVIAPFVLIGILLAHYGNVIDEMGRQEAEFLPRPLRHVNMYEDFWLPASQVLGALFLSYGPMIASLIAAVLVGIGHMPFIPGALQRSALLVVVLNLAAMVAFVIGSMILPAVLLTTTCSGTLLNLRPDRVIGVVSVCGNVYWSTALLSVLTMTIYLYGIVVSLFNLFSFCFGMSAPIDLGFFSGWLFTHAMMIAGIYLAHLVCWRLGLIYQQNQPKFPWVFQQFEARESRVGSRQTPNRRGAAGFGGCVSRGLAGTGALSCESTINTANTLSSMAMRWFPDFWARRSWPLRKRTSCATSPHLPSFSPRLNDTVSSRTTPTTCRWNFPLSVTR